MTILFGIITRLPFAFIVKRLRTVDAVAEAIRSMRVRGAPLIGAAAAWGLALAARDDGQQGRAHSAASSASASSRSRP